MKRILVVDDEPAIRNLIAELLTEEGYEVLEAANGKVGLEVATRRIPDLILMDIMMPVMDGAAAIRALKRDPATRGIRVIAMSAGVTLRAQAEDLPADGLVAKPFDLDVLLAKVALQTRRDEQPLLDESGSLDGIHY